MPDIQFVVIDNASKSASIIRQLSDVYCRAFTNSNLNDAAGMIDEELAQGHRYIIASTGQQMAGFVSWRSWGRPRHRLVELYHIGVDLQNPNAKGVGRQLIEEMERDIQARYRSYGLPGARKIFILTHADNLRAQNLYLRCGYEQQAVLPNFFRTGVDECYFAKDFPE